MEIQNNSIDDYLDPEILKSIEEEIAKDEMIMIKKN